MNQERRVRLDGVREALRVSMTDWATLEVRGDQARVVPAPQLMLLVGHLDQADPDWSLHWACDGMQPPVVRARLCAAGLEREGLATGYTLEDAKLAALADAARLYGVAVLGGGDSGSHWVDYDPDEGADTTLLEAEAETEGGVALASRPSLPPEPPRDPQMEKARGHIDDLITQIRAAGRGKEIAPILMRGYGNTLEESRQIYKELQAVLRDG